LRRIDHRQRARVQLHQVVVGDEAGQSDPIGQSQPLDEATQFGGERAASGDDGGDV